MGLDGRLSKSNDQNYNSNVFQKDEVINKIIPRRLEGKWLKNLLNLKRISDRQFNFCSPNIITFRLT